MSNTAIASPVSDGPVKLNLGAGGSPLDGYANLDRKTGQEIYPLDYSDNSVDEIRASHVFEHFSHRDSEDVLADWVRALKPGGVIKIAVPDLDAICQWHLEGKMPRPDLYLMGGHIDGDDKHGAAFTRERLVTMFVNAGLEDIREWPSDADDCSALDISLNLQGTKPLSAERECEGLFLVLASGRYGPFMHHKCIYEALGRFKNIQTRMVSGCFWHQHLCVAMEEAAKDPSCKYVMTLDFDSVFTARDVQHLYRVMEQCPEIDALAPLQMHRGHPIPLFSVEGKNHINTAMLDKLHFPVATAHFGLTIIRAESLLKLPHPWMMPKTNNGGRWGAGHVDADISFWKSWKEAGFSLHVAPGVNLGHIDEMILWCARDGSGPVYQRSDDYLKYGKPLEAK